VQPNILLIVVDDLGFNDLSLFGSEISTPNIDVLAQEGMVFTNFHVAPTCSPTRAMLLSGTDNHIAGLGNMHEEMPDNQRGQPGYEGFLNDRIAALPELIRDAGYHTYMTGKWHLGLTEETSPAARGFEKSFTIVQGGAGAFSNMLQIFGPEKAMYREDRQLLDSLPDNFYSTKFYTEKMIDYINSSHGDGKPFFSYLAFTAPHWPLQAPAESIEKQKGKYDEGYDVLRERRFNALKEKGLYAHDSEPFPKLPGEPTWESLSSEEKKYEAKKMEIYAAMVNDVDIYIGKLITYLKEI
jgi:arylsulfatase A-like enzyme